MKTIKVRPVLIESKEPTNIVLKPNGELAYSSNIPIYGIGQLHWKNKQLIFISLEDDKVEVGDYYIHDHSPTKMFKCNDKPELCSRIFCHKVITLQPQIPESYIQQFIKEYNKDGVKDVEIEWEYEEGEWMTELEDCPYAKTIDKPKLTNGFVTIIDYDIPLLEEPVEEDGELIYLSELKKPKSILSDEPYINLKETTLKDINDRMNPNTILYTEQEMLTSHHALLQAMRFNDDYSHLFINKWFEQNKKK